MKLGLYFFAAALFFISCSDDEGKNSDAKIESISVINSNIDGLVVDDEIDQLNGIVYLIPNIPTPADIDTIILEVDINISSNATITPDSINFLVFASVDDVKVYTIISESGDVKEWQVRFVGNQLPNSNFEFWHDMTGIDERPYYEPGQYRATIWATANYGTSRYGIYGTTRFPEGETTQAKLKTIETDTLPIVSGTIFTGIFDKDEVLNNPTNPLLPKSYGTRFVLRPIAMKLWYRYSPGETLIRAIPNDINDGANGFTVTEINGEDKFIIYAVLEKREGDEVVEIGRAEFVSGNKVIRVIEIEMPFVYTSENVPTHISFVASSSKDGDNYIGAIGSTLIIDDLTLIYE